MNGFGSVENTTNSLKSSSGSLISENFIKGLVTSIVGFHKVGKWVR